MKKNYTPLQRLIIPAKRIAQRLPTNIDKIVVASFGRAGSTLVFDALIAAVARKRFNSDAYLPRKIVKDYAFDLSSEKLRPGVVYKTHDYPKHLLGQEGVRAVFLFGSATDAALSARIQMSIRGETWVRKHFQHLRRPYRFEDLLREDVLGFHEQCVAWMGFTYAQVLCLRYECLWDNATTLSQFTGLDVRLPARRARNANQVSPDQKVLAHETYGPLDFKLAQLPDAFIAGPEYTKIFSPPR